MDITFFCSEQNKDSSEDTSFDIKSLKPVLNDSEGYYQIGPASKCKEHFILSNTVAFAANLPQVSSALICDTVVYK